MVGWAVRWDSWVPPESVRSVKLGGRRGLRVWSGTGPLHRPERLGLSSASASHQRAAVEDGLEQAQKRLLPPQPGRLAPSWLA